MRALAYFLLLPSFIFAQSPVEQIHPDGRYAISGGKFSYQVMLRRVADGFLPRGNAHESYLVGDPNGPGGNLYGAFAKIIDVPSRKVVTDVGERARSVERVRFSPDEKIFATGGFENKARVFDAVAGTRVREFTAPLEIETIAFFPDGNCSLTGGHQLAINFYRVDDDRLATSTRTNR